MKVVFWGTPPFADTVLHGLIDGGRRVVGVVTQPDRPAGRGRTPQAPPVKRTADEHGIPLLQPEKPRGDEFMTMLAALAPDVSVVAAYGHILSREVLDLPEAGSFNVHASLLPELRGAAPVNWAIIRGYEETGVTIMRMVEKMDAGPVVLQARLELAPDVTAGRLTDQLADLGASTLLDALSLIESGQARETAQDDQAATFAPKLSADDARVLWDQSAVELDRWIRGTDPVPGAWSKLGGLRVRLFASRVSPSETAGEEPGRVVAADPREGLQVATGGGVLEIGEVQPAGKRRMRAVEWIRGRGIAQGDRFH